MNRRKKDLTALKKSMLVVKQRKQFVTIFKIVLSLILVYFVFTKINFADVLSVIGGATPFFLVLAITLFVLSKVIAAFRLNQYFHRLNIPLTQSSNLKLYLLGMFYNLFLPGGIGGDAYKGYLIKKRFDVATKRVVAVLVLDRLSGMLLLFIYACLLAMVIKTGVLSDFRIFFGLGTITSLMVFWFLNKRFFAYVLPVFWKSIGCSSLVQLAQLASVFFILKALHIDTDIMAYLLIFLVSSIVSVLPLTIGGIGSREVTFYYGATWLALDQNTSVSISMVFFLITAMVSLCGIAFHFKKPELIEKRL
ncbi:flippase-like domain-containing protein [Flavobacteriaceae bacterium F89]|uniref:Flippase-like domain-containing protein n=1 Tax=Cerina litoralis TaxID=2874477 RepID=A0AAE3ETT5_9FLAO|nr:lysylphosphatidylglycerol synthase transmembrane domain-containing protein [Cerina litoralis]MCG2460977.1 flippase-like domain-containing protein [Cerina litoralis]